MIPAGVSDEPPLTYADSFDIPVLLRNGPAKKPRRQWRTAKHKAWAGSDGFPAADGWYAPMSGSGHYMPGSCAPAYSEAECMPLRDVAARALQGFGLTVDEGTVWNPWPAQNWPLRRSARSPHSARVGVKRKVAPWRFIQPSVKC